MIWGQRPVRRLHQSALRPFMKGKRSLVTGCPWRSSWARASNAWWPHGRQQGEGEWCLCILIAGTSEPDPAHMETSSPGLTASGAMGPAVGGAIWLRWGSPRGPVVSEGRFGGAAWGGAWALLPKTRPRYGTSDAKHAGAVRCISIERRETREGGCRLGGLG